MTVRFASGTMDGLELAAVTVMRFAVVSASVTVKFISGFVGSPITPENAATTPKLGAVLFCTPGVRRDPAGKFALTLLLS